MSTTAIPEDVRRFVLTVVPSVPFLEAMLVFKRAQGPLDADALARALYIDSANAALIVRQLQSARIVEAEDGSSAYRFAPADEALASLIDRVDACYARNIVPVSELIHSATQRSAARFADAFKWRKE